MSDSNVTVLALYDPLPWQLKPLYDTSFVLLLTGSAGGGKSRVAAEKINAYCWRYPESTWLMARKAREWNSHSIVPFMWKTVMGEDPRIRLNISDGTFFYPNGSVIYTAGMYDDKQRQAARSIGGDGGLDGAWLEEANAFSRDDFQEIIGRVRHTAASWQQIILTTNPDSPYHWIYQDLILGKGAAVYYSGARDNSNNAPSYIANLERLTGVMRDRLVLGKWVQAEGAIYDEFDPVVHIISAKKMPKLARRFRVVDFGYSNPFVCQWWGLDADNNLYRYRELYQTKKLVEELTPQIVKLTGKEHIEYTVADHDAEDRATMNKHGVSTVAAKKDVGLGIQAVKMRLKIDPKKKKPRLFFVQDALVSADPLLLAAKLPTCTEQEMPGYVWQKYADGKPNKEQPIKVNDHGCDATRYMVAYVDGMIDPTKMVDWI